MKGDGIEDVKRHSSNPLILELAKGHGAEPHPDEDVLTAFAENALLQKERDGVMEHLSVCAACRQVLSLAGGAMPEAVVQEKLHVRPARPPLRSWFPWVTVAAGLIAVSSAVVIHERSARLQTTPGNAPVNVAEEAPPPPILPPSSLAQPEVRGPEQAKAAIGVRQNQADKLATPQPQESELKKSAPVAAEQASNANVEQQNYSNQYLRSASREEDQKVVSAPAAASVSAVPAVGSVNETVEVASAAAQITTQDQVSQGTIAAKARAGSGSANGPASASTAARPAAPAFSGIAGGAGVMSGTSARTRWRINGDGRAEKKLSGSGQWQVVLSEEKSKMRVVSVSGDKVWVGGESLRLYSSNDNGATWRSVALPEKAGVRIITHIRFTSEHVGTVEAEDGIQWTTADGGLTWK